MRLSSPIFKLKRQARLRSRSQGIRLHEALDEIANVEGFQNWSHLAKNYAGIRPAERILARLNPGDMLLIGARPGHGKTLLGLELAALAPKVGRRGYFFTLDYNETDVLERYQALGIDIVQLTVSVTIDTSDDICADHIIERLGDLSRNAIVVVDYLQLLDQKRSTPDLDQQIHRLRAHAQAHGCVITAISQIDRSFDLGERDLPNADDIRLPNPLDLSLFDKLCFLHDGEIQFETANSH